MAGARPTQFPHPNIRSPWTRVPPPTPDQPLRSPRMRYLTVVAGPCVTRPRRRSTVIRPVPDWRRSALAAAVAPVTAPAAIPAGMHSRTAAE